MRKINILLLLFLFFTTELVVAQNLLAGWDGDGITGTGSQPNEVGWESSSASIPWNTSNGGGGCRFRDYDVSGGHTGYTNESDGTTSTSRQFMLRWDNGNYSSANYTYPVTLEANTVYKFSFDHLLGGSGTPPGSITAGFGTTTDGSAMIKSETFSTTTSTIIYRNSSLIFKSGDAGTYYLTFSGTWAWYAVTNLLLEEFTSTDASLNALTLSVGDLTPAFDPATTAYSVTLPASTTSIDIAATPTIEYSEISGDGTIDVSSGSGTIEITATALDGVTTETYSIDYTVEIISSDATLSDLSVGISTLNPVFDPEVLSYTVSYPSTASTIDIAANKNYPDATLTGDTGAFTVTDGAIATISITAEDGSTVKNYTITFNELSGNNYSMYLPGAIGSASNVALPAINLTTLPLTIELWFKTVGEPADYTGLLYNTSVGGLGFTGWQQQDGVYAEIAGQADPTDQYSIRTFTDVDAVYGQWNHIALVITDTSRTLYLNGVGKTEEFTPTAPDFTQGTTYLGWRADNGDNRAFNGYMDEVRFWNVAKTATELENDKFKALEGDETGLLAYYDFEDWFTVATDVTLNAYSGTITGGSYDLSFDRNDSDSDGILDGFDNCPETPNEDQADSNGNGIGDACEDSDNDGIIDINDNCPTRPNPGQEDVDEDGIGDVCDPDQIVYNEMAKGVDTLTADGAWCWFQDARALYHKGEKEQTYTGWITHDGKVQVASYNHETGEIVQTTVKTNFQIDDHNNPTFLVRNDGRILMFFSEHTIGPMFRVISDNPEDISSFGEEATFGENVTYPNPFQVGDSVVLFYRGIDWHPTMIVSEDNGDTWGEPQQFIAGGGGRPYTKYVSDDEGGIHVAFTTGHPRNEPNNKIYYTYFKNNKFYKADGSFVKDYTNTSTALDIDLDEAEVVYDASNGKGWIWDIVLDENQHPVMVYAAFPQDDQHDYYYAKYTGTAWENSFITNGGSWFPQTPAGSSEPEPNYSGGLTLDPLDPSVVYLSKQVDGVFEIFKYQTADTGANWTYKALTKNTEAGVLNIRPVVPRNRKPGKMDVLWMRGTYVYYQNYFTSIMYYSPGESLRYYDFGTAASPVDTSAIQVTNLSTFDGDYGFEDITGLTDINRSLTNAATTDYVTGSDPATFKIKLFNGTYSVKVIQGNADVAFDDLSISANDEEMISDININAEEEQISEFEVEVTNGQLLLKFEDLGTDADLWNINSLLVTTEVLTPTGLSIVEESINLYEQNTEQLSHNFSPNSALKVPVTWSSLDEQIATVTDGMILGVGAGETMIYANVSEYGLIDSCRVTVEAATYIEEDVFFDFGTETSPLMTDAIRIFESSVLNGSYGWMKTGNILSRERGSSADAPELDFVLGPNQEEFEVYLPNGSYHLTTTHGDIQYAHDSFSLYANDELLAENLNTAIGEYITQDFEVVIVDEPLILRIQDDGGSDVNWVWNTLNIREMSNNSELASITINEGILTSFEAAIQEYAIELPFGTTVIPSVEATTLSDYATVSIANATELPGSTVITVTSEDETSTTTYTLNFSVAKNTDASLTDLLVEGTTVSGFSAEISSYEVTLPFGTTVVPALTATASDTNAVVVIDNTAELPGTSTATVTAEDGVTTLTYSIHYSVDKNNDASISDLTVDGVTVTGFSQETFSYEVSLPGGTTSVPEVAVTTTDANASVSIANADALPGSTSVTITAEDGVTSLVYTVSFSVETIALGVSNARNTILLYPNPTPNELKVDWSGLDMKAPNLKIYDTSGRVLWKAAPSHGQILRVDLSNFDHGIYFLELSEDTKIVIEKFIKR